MAIHSDAFGRVTLTEHDARKFERQVSYGRPKAAAQESARRGAEMLKEFEAGNGKLTVKMDAGAFSLAGRKAGLKVKRAK